MPPDLDQLLATLRTAADARMVQRRERRAQPAPAVVAAPPAAVAKEAPSAPVVVTAEDRRAELRVQHAEVLQQAMEALRAGRISALQLASLQAARLRADAALDGHTDAAEELQALRLLDQNPGG